jgi:hypothetical protein
VSGGSRSEASEGAAGPPRPPLWALAADTLAALLAGCAVFVAIAGRSFLIAPGQIVLPSASLLLFAGAALLLIRHVAQPRPGALATLGAVRHQIRARPHAAAALRAFIATRPLVFIIGYFAVVTLGVPDRVGFTLSPDPLENLPARFDAGWYSDIAYSGYYWDRQFGRQRNIAFFPAMPLLMRPVGVALGMRAPSVPRDRRVLRALWGGVIVSLAAFATALVYLSLLSHRLGGRHAARAAPLLLATYPFAVFFNVPYSESLFLLGTVAAFHHFHREEWLRAALFGALAGFSRPNGCLLAVPLAILALGQVGDAAGDGRFRPSAAWFRPLLPRLLAASAPGAAMLAFTAYLYALTGVPFAWARMHAAWGRTWGTGPLMSGWDWLTGQGLTAAVERIPFDTLNTAGALFAAALLLPVFRLLGPAYGTFVVLNLFPPVFAGGALSMGRITSTLFPIFIVLAILLPRRSAGGWAAAFALLQGFAATLFFTWRELF